jgi:hypothetical protein
MRICRNCSRDVSINHDFCLACRSMYWHGLRHGTAFGIALILFIWAFSTVGLSAQQQYDVVNGPIVHTYTELPATPVVIEHKTIYPSAEGQPWAIDLTFPRAESGVRTRVIIKHVTIEPGNGFYFRNFIRLVNAWLCEIDTVTLIAPAGLPEPLAHFGLHLLGQSTDCKIRNLRISHVEVCAMVQGEAEGTLFDGLSCVPARYCVVAWPESGGMEPGLWIVNSHCNTSVAGFILRDRLHFFLRDNLLYFDDHFTGSAGKPFYGVYCERCRDGWTSNTIVTPSNSGAEKKPNVPWTQVDSTNIEGRATFRKRH